MLYLDSNTFVYAAINTKDLGENARELLQKIQEGEMQAETSALTFDEVFWAVKKYDLEVAFEACHALLNFPKLYIVPVDRELVVFAMQLIKKHRLASRDAIHAATAIAGKADALVSTDAHFVHKIQELKRRSLITSAFESK